MFIFSNIYQNIEKIGSDFLNFRLFWCDAWNPNVALLHIATSRTYTPFPWPQNWPVLDHSEGREKAGPPLSI